MNYDQTAGVLLIGGQSSRMGVDKFTLKINNQYLLHKMLNLYVDNGINNIVISCRVEQTDILNELLQTWQYNDAVEIQFVYDIYKQTGPTGGIYSCLNQLSSHDDLIIMAIDMYGLNNDIIKSLLDYENTNVVFDKHPLPCKILINQQNTELLKNQLDNEIYAIRQWQKKLQPLITVTEHEHNWSEQLSINLNSPDDVKNIVDGV